MRKPNRIAVFCSDLHLSMHQPACRADANWMAVQQRYLAQLKELAEDLPILCAGDIFDRWNPPPELIHFALVHLPDEMICVPGQHDLPNHRIENMRRSGYGVLAKAGKIRDISGQTTGNLGGCVAHGFGWEQPITPPKQGSTNLLHVALIHRYCWTPGKEFPGAPKENEVPAFKKLLAGYDVAVFGDNHKGFLSKAGSCTVLNCGGFIRRKSDEIDYQPCIGVLHDDGSVVRLRLDVSLDKFHKVVKEREESPVDMKQFIDMLSELGEQGLNFEDAVKRHLESDDIHPRTKEIILSTLKGDSANE